MSGSYVFPEALPQQQNQPTPQYADGPEVVPESSEPECVPNGAEDTTYRPPKGAEEYTQGTPATRPWWKGKTVLAIIIAAVIALVIGLSVGLGVGLSKKDGGSEDR